MMGRLIGYSASMVLLASAIGIHFLIKRAERFYDELGIRLPALTELFLMRFLDLSVVAVIVGVVALVIGIMTAVEEGDDTPWPWHLAVLALAVLMIVGAAGAVALLLPISAGLDGPLGG